MNNSTVVGRILRSPYIRPAVWDARNQIIAFYNEQRELTVAHRATWGEQWKQSRTGSKVGWDSHNYPSLAVDGSGTVHLAGNMHATPLVYFRSDHDSGWSFNQISAMVDPAKEQQVTYPEFVIDDRGNLQFWFRDGASGNAVQRVYSYDLDDKEWKDVLPSGLIDGQGARSAYLDYNRAYLSEGGRYHLLWLWRDSPNAESCHSICYAWSEDLLTWHNVEGGVLDLPITFQSPVLVGQEEMGTGIINNNLRLVVDESERPYIVTQQRDDRGFMQIVLWQRMSMSWEQWWLTDWDAEWDFSGKGTLPFRLEIGDPMLEGSMLRVPVRYDSTVVEILCDLIAGMVQVSRAELPWKGIRGVQRDSESKFYMASQTDASCNETLLAWEGTLENRDLPAPDDNKPGTVLTIGSIRGVGPANS